MTFLFLGEMREYWKFVKTKESKVFTIPLSFIKLWQFSIPFVKLSIPAIPNAVVCDKVDVQGVGLSNI